VLLTVALLAGCASGPGAPTTTTPTSPAPSPTGATPSASGSGCAGNTTPDQPGDPSQSRPALRDWYQLAAMDPSAPRILVGETGFDGGSGQAAPQSMWGFDVCRNTWTDLGDGSMPRGAGSALQQLVADTSAATVLGIPAWQSPVWTYDPTTGAWSAMDVTGGDSEAWSLAAFDPDAGRLLLFDANALPADAAASGVKELDAVAPAWVGLDLAEPDGQRPQPRMDSVDVAYDSAARRLVLVITAQSGDAAAQTWRFDPDARSWSRGADVPDTLQGGYPADGWAMAYEPGSARTWLFADTAMLGYDARADDWLVAERDEGWPASETIGGVAVDPTARIVGTMVADPVHDRLVVIGGNVREAGQQPGGFVKEGSLVVADDVWAYAPATNTWTMLLAPSDQPASYGPG
jgi:hypothetical protein